MTKPRQHEAKPNNEIYFCTSCRKSAAWDNFECTCLYHRTPTNSNKNRYYGRYSRMCPYEFKIVLCEEQGYRCCYCSTIVEIPLPGKPLEEHSATIEHIIPVSKGGINHWCNCVIACYKCNKERSNKFDALEFYEFKQMKNLLMKKPLTARLAEFIK